MTIQADLLELETLSRRLGTCSNEVDDLKHALTTLISTTTWTGGAADRFRQAWEAQFRPALDALARELTVASQEVSRRKIAIDHAAN
ncbi:WXG100 family type VII secretion target [Actinomadura decatromicini]|uniref:WXG100 family type VII secretion target n=1 Tax=Actinomadura decatromicini TaxID=2604572 RepID=A0A5D3F7F5_9ACTN|nr:WXG100 family type VII secretion target [Actinomadura decatromicini]TYK43640.1 WXG100 family type VII secretion target [Actinomadura decatromicini]